jgi:quercetin dioxygenase-like cupin family protein
MNWVLSNLALGLGLLFILSSSVLSEELERNNTQYNRVLFQSSIEPENGTDVLIREAYFPPGWEAPRHYHNGNLFIYVIEGEFEVTMEPDGKQVYLQGQALQMKPGVHMDARNPSNTNPLKLSVFQVGRPNDPFVVPAE